MKIIISENIEKPNKLLENLSLKGNIGAVLAFIGIVREFSEEGDKVVKLFYEAHPTLAEKTIEKIVEDAVKKYGLKDVIVEHKIGEAKVGETVFVVIVASKHREEGYRGLIEIVDRIKREAPIWKKEYTVSKSYWKS
ncbi:MAG: molybdenum cofactor biosynthesis protein MoaE [Thermoproteales archaeon]|nr:molybdenum cofactor biosynthesis protein MoaE [Thermoproteales archaeon]RLE65625.1 MAG: molybdenum cofactor biosynthesis protein MoaE [Thermoprotei archaeon]